MTGSWDVRDNRAGEFARTTSLSRTCSRSGPQFKGNFTGHLIEWRARTLKALPIQIEEVSARRLRVRRILVFFGFYDAVHEPKSASADV